LTPPRATLGWIVLAVALAGDVACVAHFGADFPRADDWRDASVLLGDRPLTLKWLWSPHGIHRIPLPRLTRFALYRLAGRDFRAVLFFNVGIMAAGAALMLLAVRRLRGSPSRLDVVVPLLLLGPAHFLTFLWAFQVQFALSSALLIVAIAIVASIRGAPTTRGLAVLGLSLPLQVMTGANGVALALPLMTWLGMALAASRRERGAGWWVAAAGLALAAGVFIAYPVGQPKGTSSAVSLEPIVGTFFQFMSTAFVATEALWGPRGLLVVVLASFAAVLVGRACLAVPAEQWRASGLLACLASMFLLGVFVAGGRAEMTTDAGLQTRYTTLAVPIVCLAYLGVVLYGGARSRRTVGVFLLAGAVFAIVVGSFQAYGFGAFRRRQLLALASDAERGLSIEAIAARNGTTLNEYDPSIIRVALGQLIAHRAWPFANYRQDPDARGPVATRTRLDVEALPVHDVVREGDGFRPTGPRPQILLRLPQATAVARIELRYSMKAARYHMMVVEVHWGLTRGGDVDPASQLSGFPVFPADEPQTATASVYDTIDAILVVPDRTATWFQIHDVALLELAPDWIPSAP
jgi:hypothetical protein